MRRSIRIVLLTLVALALVPAPAAAAPGDTARYILPPGNYGGLPTTAELDSTSCRSTTGSRRCAATSPRRHRRALPARELQPDRRRRARSRPGRPGLRLVYDDYGVPHVYGKTRADVAFGAGWVTARDRALLLQLGRGPARVAVADVPGIDAFSPRHQRAVVRPEPAGRGARHASSRTLIVKTYGAKGRQIIADAQAYADGINAYWQGRTTIDEPPATVNDVIAVTAFIGSIFGAGGGGEAAQRRPARQAPAAARARCAATARGTT